MSWALTAAAVMATGSVYSSIESNKQAGRNARASAAQSTEEAQANYKALARNYMVTTNNINNSISEANNAVGMELSQAKLDALKAEGTTSTAIASNGFVGNTAARISQTVGVKSALMADQLQQKAESNYKDLLLQLDEARYNFENGNINNAIAGARSATQIEVARSNSSVGIGGMISGVISAGASGYMTASSIGREMATTPTTK